jgi:hypothetical protein
MNFINSKILSSSLLAMACWAGAARGADIVVTGNWSQTVNQADLASGAGSDIRTPIESSSAQATLDIANTLGGSWSVMARKSDLNWPAGVGIAVKRTSDGSGGGSISGGTAYITLTTSDQTLFSGSGDRTGIQLQLETDGLSVSHGADNYSLNIIYTIQ